jgi:hypothetical protein
MNDEKQNMNNSMWQRIHNTGLLTPDNYDGGEYNELLLKRRILNHSQIMKNFPKIIKYIDHDIVPPFLFPNCLLFFLIYKKELYYREDVYSKPVKVESAENLANVFRFQFVGYEYLFTEIFNNIIYFLNMPEKKRSDYETEAWRAQRQSLHFFHANPEDDKSGDVLKIEITYILKFKDILGEYYINNGISPFLKYFLFCSYTLKSNVVIFNERDSRLDILTPLSLETVIKENDMGLLPSQSLQEIHKKLGSCCRAISVINKRSFNISGSNRLYEFFYKKKHLFCEPFYNNSLKRPLAPCIIWEHIRRLGFNEVESLFKTIGQRESCIKNFCMLFNSIRLNKYERKYFIFQIEEECGELFHQLMEKISLSDIPISFVSSTKELFPWLTNITLEKNQLLLFDLKEPAKESFLEKLKNIVCGNKINFTDKWSYSYTNSSTVCLVDNGNINIDRLKELCTPYNCQVVPITFTKSLLEELIKLYSSTIENYYRPSIDFFLLLCSFYDFKASKKEDEPSIGKEKILKDFIDTYCILDDIKDDSSKLRIRQKELHNAYLKYADGNQSDKYKLKYFKNKIFEMGYANKDFGVNRKHRTRSENHLMFYGIQLDENSEINVDNNVPLYNDNTFTIESIYDFYKQLFTEIQTSLK